MSGAERTSSVGDSYLAARGGHARSIDVRCAACFSLAFLYQKDGDGPLLRCYANRVLEPRELVDQLKRVRDVSQLRRLTCRGCGLPMGDPMRYTDGRLAWRLRPEAYWAGSVEVGPRRTALLWATAKAHGLPVASVEAELARARATLAPLTVEVPVVEHGYRRELRVTRLGYGPVDLPAGPATLFELGVADHWGRYAAVAFAPVGAVGGVELTDEPLLLRTDSGCSTGQIFGDATCDCREQLALAMELMVGHGQGLVVHIPAQDGRGCGVAFKLATLRLQRSLGLDTIEASQLLTAGSHVDRRTYAGVVAVLQALGIGTDQPVVLLSNNPAKAEVLRENGYTVRVQPMTPSLRAQTRRHLEAKRDKLGHTIEFDAVDP